MHQSRFLSPIEEIYITSFCAFRLNGGLKNGESKPRGHSDSFLDEIQPVFVLICTKRAISRLTEIEDFMLHLSPSVL